MNAFLFTKLRFRGAAAIAVALLFFFRADAGAQKSPASGSAEKRTMIFAVLNDGKTLEPIGLAEKGSMISGESEGAAQYDLDTYFRAGKNYSIIFGGAADGTAKIVKKETGECAGQRAAIEASPTRARLKGYVMALATDGAVPKRAPYRRMPTREERSAVEALVRAELIKQGVTANAAKQLKYHNLTAIDIDGDETPEFVGTFWVNSKPNERSTLFFIAGGSGDNLKFQHGEFQRYGPDDIMSGEVEHLDEGIYHDLLLDYMDIDGDGTAEVFATARSFEGRHFSVYKRKGAGWEKVYNSYNYYCGF